MSDDKGRVEHNCAQIVIFIYNYIEKFYKMSMHLVIIINEFLRKYLPHLVNIYSVWL